MLPFYLRTKGKSASFDMSPLRLLGNLAEAMHGRFSTNESLLA
jgi:hypothetical protein